MKLFTSVRSVRLGVKKEMYESVVVSSNVDIWSGNMAERMCQVPPDTQLRSSVATI